MLQAVMVESDWRLVPLHLSQWAVMLHGALAVHCKHSNSLREELVARGSVPRYTRPDLTHLADGKDGSEGAVAD